MEVSKRKSQWRTNWLPHWTSMVPVYPHDPSGPVPHISCASWHRLPILQCYVLYIIFENSGTKPSGESVILTLAVMWGICILASTHIFFSQPFFIFTQAGLEDFIILSILNLKSHCFHKVLMIVSWNLIESTLLELRMFWTQIMSSKLFS